MIHENDDKLTVRGEMRRLNPRERVATRKKEPSYLEGARLRISFLTRLMSVRSSGERDSAVRRSFEAASRLFNLACSRALTM